MHFVDLGESFPTHIFLQNSVSIQPRTSPVKFRRSLAVVGQESDLGTPCVPSELRPPAHVLEDLPRVSGTERKMRRPHFFRRKNVCFETKMNFSLRRVCAESYQQVRSLWSRGRHSIFTRTGKTSSMDVHLLGRTSSMQLLNCLSLDRNRTALRENYQLQ